MIEKRNEIFPHLGKMPPKIQDIIKLNTDFVDEDKLKTLEEHFSSLEKQFPNSKELIEEICLTKERINCTITLSAKENKQVTGGIMEVAMSNTIH